MQRIAAWVACCVVGLAGGAGLLGCNNSPGALLGAEEATALAPIKVDLPPPPSFAGSEIPLQYSDGVLSIHGLRKQGQKHLGHEVTVRAYLIEVYQCHRCPRGHECKPCDQPHFFVADARNGNKDKALMVVDYLKSQRQPPQLGAGQRYRVTGMFVRSSRTGFAASEGLLEFIKISPDSDGTETE